MLNISLDIFFHTFPTTDSKLQFYDARYYFYQPTPGDVPNSLPVYILFHKFRKPALHESDFPRVPHTECTKFGTKFREINKDIVHIVPRHFRKISRISKQDL